MPIDAHLPCVTLPMPTPIGAPLPPVFGENYPAECRSVVGFPCLFVMLWSLSVESRSCDWFLVCHTDTDTDTEFYYTLAAISRIAE